MHYFFEVSSIPSASFVYLFCLDEDKISIKNIKISRKIYYLNLIEIKEARQCLFKFVKTHSLSGKKCPVCK